MLDGLALVMCKMRLPKRFAISSHPSAAWNLFEVPELAFSLTTVSLALTLSAIGAVDLPAEQDSHVVLPSPLNETALLLKHRRCAHESQRGLQPGLDLHASMFLAIFLADADENQELGEVLASL